MQMTFYDPKTNTSETLSVPESSTEYPAFQYMNLTEGLCRDVVFEELFDGLFDEDEVRYPIVFLVNETAFVLDSTSSDGYNKQDLESTI